MISSPEPSAVASSITLAPKYVLSGWGSGRSLNSSIAGRYLLGMFQPSPVASRAVVSAMRYPPSFPSIPSIPCCILFKHSLDVNSYHFPICRPRQVLFLSCLELVTGGFYARGHNRQRPHWRRRHRPDGRSGRWALDNLTAKEDRPRASILLPGSYLLLSAKLLYRGVSPLRPTPDKEEILEVEHILLDFGLILGAGLVSQFLATFLRIPEMIVLVAVGALIGPSVLGLVLLVLPGVAITAFIVAVVVAPIFGVSLLVALMIGAVLASTDPAIIIPLFERLGLRPKVSQTVIAESAFNDVTGTVLTLTLVSAVEAAHFSVSGPVFEFFKELALGAVIGVGAGLLLAYAVASTARAGMWDESPGVAILAVVALVYFSSETLCGSAYLAAFVMGLIVGNMEEFKLRQHEESERMLEDFVGQVAEIAVLLVFVTLGINLPFDALKDYL